MHKVITRIRTLQIKMWLKKYAGTKCQPLK